MRLFGNRIDRQSTKTAEIHAESDAPIDRARRRLAAATSIDDVITAVRDTGRSILGADGVTVVQRDGDEVVYVTEDAISPLWSGQRFPIRVCVSGMAIQSRTPIVIADILNDRRVPQNAYLSTFVKSMVVVPVGHDEPQMAIGAYWQVAEPIAAVAVDRLTILATAAADAIARLEGPSQPGRQVA